MQYLKQATEVNLNIGPFIDDTDGISVKTDLTIAQSDVRVSKNGAAFAEKNDSGSATHDEKGFYIVALDATDTSTTGRLIVNCDPSGALPVFQEFTVLPANSFDTIVAGTDTMQCDITQVGGSATIDSLSLSALLTRVLAVLDGDITANVNTGVLTIKNKAGNTETTQTIDVNGNRTIS